MAENELQLFEKNNLVIFQRLAEFKKQKELMEKQEKMLKTQLEEAMVNCGVKSFSNDLIAITYVNGSSSESIDLKKLEEKEPELYKDLLNDYKKVTTKKSYVIIKVK